MDIGGHGSAWLRQIETKMDEHGPIDASARELGFPEPVGAGERCQNKINQKCSSQDDRTQILGWSREIDW